jgi:hypothetical protein
MIRFSPQSTESSYIQSDATGWYSHMGDIHRRTSQWKNNNALGVHQRINR